MRGAIWCGILAAALLPMAAQAEGMTVATFLAKAKALQATGPQALASSDLSLVRDEVKNAATAYRAQIEADKAADKPPRACPPPVGKAKIDASTIITEFQTLPPAKRTVSVKTAFFAMMDRRFPCD